MSTDLVTKSGQPVARGRIRAPLASAIRLIVEKGYTIRDAAKAVGYQQHSLVQALRKPHVQAFRADVKRAWMESRTERAWRTVADLADRSPSDDVRLKAARTFLDAAGELTPPDGDAGKGAKTLIQIVAQNLQLNADQTGQVLSERLPGVIETLPVQRIEHDPSDS